jgi:hypothetical protein
MLGPFTTMAWTTKTLRSREIRAAGRAVVTPALRAHNRKWLALDARVGPAFLLLDVRITIPPW